MTEARRRPLPRHSIHLQYTILAVAILLAVPLLTKAGSLPLRRAAAIDGDDNSSGIGSTPRVAQIGLLHMYDSVRFFQRLGSLTGENKERYAYRHGYDIIFSTPSRTSGLLKPAPCNDAANSDSDVSAPDASGTCWRDGAMFDIDHTRAPTFGKIKLALASCKGRDDAWLLWSDADAMVINQTVPLETIIDDFYDIIFSYDWLMLNAGMLLIKCSKWSVDFLTSVYDERKFDRARALDQSAIQEFVNNMTNAERDRHIKILPKRAMDVYTEEYQPGDFLVHFAGKLYEATESGLYAIAQQFDILSLTDDVEDIAAFFRGRYMLNYYSGTCPMGKGERQSSCKPDDERRIKLREPLGAMSMPNRYRHVGLRYYWLGDWKDTYDVKGWNDFKQPLATSSKEEREKRKGTRAAGHAQAGTGRDDDAAAAAAGGDGHEHDSHQKHVNSLKPNLPDLGEDDELTKQKGNAREDSTHHGEEDQNFDRDHDQDNDLKHRPDAPEAVQNFDTHVHSHGRAKRPGVQDAHAVRDNDGDDNANDDDDDDRDNDGKGVGNGNRRRSPYLWVFLVCGTVAGCVLYGALTRRKKMSSKTQ